MMLFVDSRIEKWVDGLTAETLNDSDWGGNLELVDNLNRQPDITKDVLKCIRKRLGHKSTQVQWLTLMVNNLYSTDCMLIACFIRFMS